mmetsp:Transcript_18694/g.31147  ORF Transcript_18694/g.31147 Transcript_18694/m.31147 type:complete len:364 (-) Transcript_18694:235-1326(-)
MDVDTKAVIAADASLTEILENYAPPSGAAGFFHVDEYNDPHETLKNVLKAGAKASTEHLLLFLNTIQATTTDGLTEFPIEAAHMLLNSCNPKDIGVVLASACEDCTNGNTIEFIEHMIKKGAPTTVNNKSAFDSFSDSIPPSEQKRLVELAELYDKHANGEDNSKRRRIDKENDDSFDIYENTEHIEFVNGSVPFNEDDEEEVECALCDEDAAQSSASKFKISGGEHEYWCLSCLDGTGMTGCMRCRKMVPSNCDYYWNDLNKKCQVCACCTETLASTSPLWTRWYASQQCCQCEQRFKANLLTTYINPASGRCNSTCLGCKELFIDEHEGWKTLAECEEEEDEQENEDPESSKVRGGADNLE